MLKLQMTSGHVRVGHLQSQYGSHKLRSNMVANNSNMLQKCSIYTRRINSFNTWYTQIISLTPNVILLLNGGQNIGNVGVTSDKAITRAEMSTVL